MKNYSNYGFQGLICVFWTAVIIGCVFLSRVTFFKQPNSINVLTWQGTLDREYADLFERETGIKVNLSVYATNEELLVKLRAHHGEGYDLIVPSDYTIEKLVHDGLLKKLDKTKLDFFDKLNPLLLGQSFDPHNDYSIPFEWEIYVVALNTHYIRSAQIPPRAAWNLIFAPQKVGVGRLYRLAMVNDPVEAVLFAADYLYKNIEWLDPQQIKAVKDLLIRQKAWIEVYTDVRTDYYLGTDNATASIVQSSAAWRAVRDYDNIDFIIPADTFISIENCALPNGTTKEDFVYKFLNFFYSKESYQFHFNRQMFCPARLDVIEELPVDRRLKKIMRSSPEQFAHYRFIKDILPEEDKHNLWVMVKA